MTLNTRPLQTESELVYAYDGGLYINLTRRCPTACTFCIKFSWDYTFRGHNLRLPAEPSVEEILRATPMQLSGYRHVVFCGYGESTYRLKEMEELSRTFRLRGARQIRLNTIGLGSLIQGRNIAPELGRFLDVVSVSLNTADPAEWITMHRPLPEFREGGFQSVLQFIRDCAEAGVSTVVTAVEGPGVPLDAVRRLAEERGATFRSRPFLEEKDNR